MYILFAIIRSVSKHLHREVDSVWLSSKVQIIFMSVGGRGGRGNRDKERDQKPLTKEALDADLDEV